MNHSTTQTYRVEKQKHHLPMPTGKLVLLFMNVAKFFNLVTDCNKMCISCAKVEIPPHFSDYPFEI